MVRACATAILICALGGALAQAQTPPPTPVWPPDPAAIFADGINWQLDPGPDPASAGNPIIDHDARVIRVYTPTGSWTDYPFPPQAEDVESARFQPDGRIRVWFRSADSSSIWTEDVLILDPATKEYVPAPLTCRDQEVQAIAGEGHWIAIQPNASSEQEFVCHTETGEELAILPNGYSRWQVDLSPDQRWLAMVGWDAEDFTFDLYSYSMETGNLISLGTIPNEGYIDVSFGFCDWVSPTRGTLCGGERISYLPGYYFAFDVSQPQSLEKAFSAWRENLFELTDRPGYASIYSETYFSVQYGSWGPDHYSCQLTVYDGQGLRRYELGYECPPMALDWSSFAPAIRHDDTLYYLTKAQKEATVSELHSFDLKTETVSPPIFAGEIESILAISPDHQYIVLLMDDNGALDKNYEACCFQQRGWQVVVLNQNIVRLVYTSEPLGMYGPEQVLWMSPSTLVIAPMAQDTLRRVTEEGDQVYHMIPASLQHITLNQDSSVDVHLTTRYGASREPYTTVFNVSPDQQYALASLALVDLNTLEGVPILHADLPSEYDIDFRWAEAHTLLAQISLRDSQTPPVTYRITVEKGECGD